MRRKQCKRWRKILSFVFFFLQICGCSLQKNSIYNIAAMKTRNNFEHRLVSDSYNITGGPRPLLAVRDITYQEHRSAVLPGQKRNAKACHPCCNLLEFLAGTDIHSTCPLKSPSLSEAPHLEVQHSFYWLVREIVRQCKNRCSRTAVLVHHDSDCHIYEQQHLRVKFERLLTLRKERQPFDDRLLPTCAGRQSDILSLQEIFHHGFRDGAPRGTSSLRPWF